MIHTEQPSDLIEYIPLLLLTIACGIDSGALLAGAFLCHLGICKGYKRSILGTLWKEPIAKRTAVVIAVWIGAMVLTFPFNNSQPGMVLTYMERLVPLVLIFMLARRDVEVFRIVWIGMMLSLCWYMGNVAMQPTWIEHRLYGPFSSPNGLAALLLLLLPVVLVGAIHYRAEYPKLAAFSGILSLLSIVMIICTGSRNAYISLGVMVVILFYLVYRYRDWLVVKAMGGLFLAACVVLIALAPGIVSQRLNKDVSKDGRVYLTHVAIELIKERPIVGIGLQQWGTVYHERFEKDNPNFEKNMQSPHNIYLHVWNETGLIGLSGFLALLFFQLKQIICSLRAIHTRRIPWVAGFSLPIIGSLFFGLFDYAFFNRHMMHLYWFYWGLCVYSIPYYLKEKWQP